MLIALGYGLDGVTRDIRTRKEGQDTVLEQLQIT